MTGRNWILVATLAAVTLGPMTVRAQTTYQCKRLTGGGCVISGDVNAWENGTNGVTNSLSDSSLTLASDSDTASYGGAYAEAEATASLPTAPNATTASPQVSCSTTMEVSATQRSGVQNANAWANPLMVAGGTFEVQGTYPTNNLDFAGSMQFVATGGTGGSWTVQMQAECGNSTAGAVGMDGMWSVSGTLQTSNGPTTFRDVYLGGLNVTYTTEESTSVGSTHYIAASCNLEAEATAPPDDETDLSGSCTSSFSVSG